VSELDRSPSGRKLHLRARALRQSQTRQRITQAAVELHQQRGPLHTTITEIAQRAGVERLTVYRHFPNETSLHQACQQHFFASHPLPNLELWRDVPTFPNRLEVGLSELYEYWEQTHEMFSSVLRDHEVDPKRSGAGVVKFMSRATEALLVGQDVSGQGGQILSAAVNHAVHFYTWRSLVQEQGLSNADAVKLMREMIIRAEHND
jgi:AcrR family transcriptional regulator